MPIPTAVYARCVAHDRIARPVLPVLMDMGWAPGMAERVTAATTRTCHKGARR